MRANSHLPLNRSWLPALSTKLFPRELVLFETENAAHVEGLIASRKGTEIGPSPFDV